MTLHCTVLAFFPLYFCSKKKNTDSWMWKFLALDFVLVLKLWQNFHLKLVKMLQVWDRCPEELSSQPSSLHHTVTTIFGFLFLQLSPCSGKALATEWPWHTTGGNVLCSAIVLPLRLRCLRVIFVFFFSPSVHYIRCLSLILVTPQWQQIISGE